MPEKPDYRKKIRRGIERTWEVLNTPLVGRDYSVEEQVENPKRITSPERIFALMSTPLGIAGELGGLGMLGMAGRSAKLAKTGKGLAPSPRLINRYSGGAIPPSAPTNSMYKPLRILDDSQYKAYLGNEVLGRR